jgi:allophanate hydrolase
MAVAPPIQQSLHRFEAAAGAAAPEIWISRSPDPPALLGASDGALAGLLVAVKDNIDVAGFSTTLACPEHSYRPTRSATAVERLLAAGASVVGKTNLDQFACGLVGTRSPYGEVPNAFLPEYVSGGSSSGSAVAVALGLVDLALGTDTAGSGRVPAGFNNIVGVKPSRGLISTRGVFPACRHLDCVSIFARSVPLAARVLRVCAGFDAEDPFSRTLALDAAFMPERFRFAIPDDTQLEFFGDELAERAFGDACALLRDQGGRQSTQSFAAFAAVAQALYEEAWVAERYAAVRSFFDRQPEAVHPVVRSILERGRHFSAADLFDAMARLGEWRQSAGVTWDDCDVLVVPTAPSHPTRAAVAADPIEQNRRLGLYTNFVNLLDQAAVAVPASMRPDGLPFGVTLIGPAGSDLRLLDLAQRLHRATGLPEGATGVAQASPPIEFGSCAPRAPGSTANLVVVGAHLDGLALNGQLRSRGARLIGPVRTAPIYRLYALPGGELAKPGLVRAPAAATSARAEGVSIDAELWEMPLSAFGSFVAGIPAPLGMGTIELSDGSRVQGFVCEAAAVQGAQDISRFGGWRAYLASLDKAA